MVSDGEGIREIEFDEEKLKELIEHTSPGVAGQPCVCGYALMNDAPQNKPFPQSDEVDPNAFMYLIGFEGLATNQQGHEVVVRIEVFDVAGALVYEEQDREILLKDKVGCDYIIGRFRISSEGEFRIKLRITDRIADVTVVHEDEFTVR